MKLSLWSIVFGATIFYWIIDDNLTIIYSSCVDQQDMSISFCLNLTNLSLITEQVNMQLVLKTNRKLHLSCNSYWTIKESTKLSFYFYYFTITESTTLLYAIVQKLRELNLVATVKFHITTQSIKLSNIFIFALIVSTKITNHIVDYSTISES